MGTGDQGVRRQDRLRFWQQARSAQCAALPEIHERLSSLGLMAQSSTMQEFADVLRSEHGKVGRIVKEANVKFE
jgi:tripartite-type tricarboxylate transporter receptor subunit TctC